MQINTVLDDNLIAEALQLTGVKTEQALIEQAVKELINNYQANLGNTNKTSWLGCMKTKGKITGDIVTPVMNENDWEVLSK